MRGVETATGFGWKHPGKTFKCVKLVNDKLGEFKTGYFQWLFQAKNSDVNCDEDMTLTRTDDAETTVMIKLTIERGYCPAPA
jgi:hypothetical protein